MIFILNTPQYKKEKKKKFEIHRIRIRIKRPIMESKRTESQFVRDQNDHD